MHWMDPGFVSSVRPATETFEWKSILLCHTGNGLSRSTCSWHNVISFHVSRLFRPSCEKKGELNADNRKETRSLQLKTMTTTPIPLLENPYESASCTNGTSWDSHRKRAFGAVQTSLSIANLIDGVKRRQLSPQLLLILDPALENLELAKTAIDQLGQYILYGSQL